MRVRQALILGRVSNLPTTWSNVLCGAVLAGAPLSSWQIAALCFAVSLFYTAGMYLNDAFDRRIDARERPERPIPSGQVSARTVFVAGFTMLLSGIALVAGLALGPLAAGLGPIAAAVALALVIVLYDLFHKNNPLSPLLMGVCRVLVYALAGLSGGDMGAPWFVFGCAVLLSYLIGLTYVAKQETLRRLRNTWPLLFLAAPLGYAPAYSSAFSLSCTALFAGFVGYALSFVLSERRRSIPRAVGHFIAGIALLDAMLIAGQGAVVLAGLCALFAALTLVLQRVVPGT